MDRESLVNRLRDTFDPDLVNGFVLLPAYGGIVNDSYALGVSAPSLHGRSKASKIKVIFELIFEHMSIDERKSIDRVAVFDSTDELVSSSLRDFNSEVANIFAELNNAKPKLYEMH